MIGLELLMESTKKLLFGKNWVRFLDETIFNQTLMTKEWIIMTLFSKNLSQRVKQKKSKSTIEI